MQTKNVIVLFTSKIPSAETCDPQKPDNQIATQVDKLVSIQQDPQKSNLVNRKAKYDRNSFKNILLSPHLN